MRFTYKFLLYQRINQYEKTNCYVKNQFVGT